MKNHHKVDPGEVFEQKHENLIDESLKFRDFWRVETLTIIAFLRKYNDFNFSMFRKKLNNYEKWNPKSHEHPLKIYHGPPLGCLRQHGRPRPRQVGVPSSGGVPGIVCW